MPHILTDDNTNICYTEKGKGKTIVFIHGWAANKASFAIPAHYLSKKFRVIIYDLRGHGQSDVPENGFTMKRCAEDLEQLMDKLDLEDVTLIAWSMGALVLFEYIKRFGCRRIDKTVIIDMTPKFISDEEWKLGIYDGKLTHEENLKIMSELCCDWKGFVERFTKDIASNLDERQIKAIIKGSMANEPYVLLSMWVAMANSDYREVISKINVPTLILYGEKSTLYPNKASEYLNSKIPNSRVEKFEGCNHLLVMEDTDKFIKVVENFVLDK
ncbi:alpha/beta hydrolase [Clostridium aestuarii]|uniref:Alpha/beta hydrolase n=1 Tax=Clostridium aestuarii TaxID=338193 RepID=A0ABT4CZX8_9CLOT|nr:alpha/beta hydrolase [Clostridium aestuarii]MCY6484392.1 alpha/beta hydrolase [Clostridium aestuarii]